MRKYFRSGCKIKILCASSTIILFVGPLSAQTQPRQTTAKTTMLLVDTDDACRLTVDDQEEGIITPEHSKKIDVGLGDHIVKCVVEGIPDLAWRKVVTAKSGEQAAAIVALKALHIQYDQAVGKIEQHKEQAAAAEEKAKTDAAEFPQKLFEAIKGRWEYDYQDPDDPGRGYSWTVEFKDLNDLKIAAQLTLDDDNERRFRKGIFTASFKISPPTSNLTQEGGSSCVQITEKSVGKNQPIRTVPCNQNYQGTQIRFLDSTHFELKFCGNCKPMVFQKK